MFGGDLKFEGLTGITGKRCAVYPPSESSGPVLCK